MSVVQAPMPPDGNQKPMPLSPAKVSLATTYDTTVSGTTQVTFNAATTFIRVCALTQPICMKWGTGTASAATNGFDHIIPTGQICDYAIPDQTTGTAAGTMYTAANFIEQAASATLIVSEF